MTSAGRSVLLPARSDTSLPNERSSEDRLADYEIHVSIEPITMKGWLVRLGSNVGGPTLQKLCSSRGEVDEWLSSIAGNLVLDQRRDKAIS